MTSRFLTNPFFLYILSFGTVVLFYTLGWSDLYPALSLSLVTFFLISFGISVACGLRVGPTSLAFRPIPEAMIFRWITLGLVAGFALECWFAGHIPLLAILSGDPGFDYRFFGIPHLHVVLVTLSSFVALQLFYQLMSRFSVSLFLHYLINLFMGIVIVNRGMFLMVITGSLFLYILRMKVLPLRQLLFSGAFMLLIFYGFGILGNLRQAHRTGSEQMIQMTHASSRFKNSIVPGAYIWSYVYFTSPLANLQTTINVGTAGNEWKSFLVYELLPDFISKRIGKQIGIERVNIHGVTDWLTASTVYARSFLFVGWWGMGTIFIFFISSTYLYLYVISKLGTYRLTGLAILNTVVIFNTFDNMYAFTGLSFQLLYPILFAGIQKFITQSKSRGDLASQ